MVFHDFCLHKDFYPIQFLLVVLQRVFDRLLFQIFFCPSEEKTKQAEKIETPFESNVDLVNDFSKYWIFVIFFYCKVLATQVPVVFYQSSKWELIHPEDGIL